MKNCLAKQNLAQNPKRPLKEILRSSFFILILTLFFSGTLSAAQCNGKADVWFANDESGSVEVDEFEDALDFIYQVSGRMTFDFGTGLQAGITGWDDQVDSIGVIVPITDQFSDQNDSGLISSGNITLDNDGVGVRELYSAKVTGGNGTRLDYATDYLSSLIAAGNGRRTDTPQIAVILTDGYSYQLANASSGGGSTWSAKLAGLRTSGPDGTKVIHMLIDAAAAAYNADTDGVKTLMDDFVTDGDLLFVGDTYAEIANPAQNYIDGLVDTICENTLPTVDIQGEPLGVNTQASYPVTFEFSLDVTGFEVGEINVSNGSAGSLVAVDGNTYKADITPDGNGNITINIPQGAAQSAAGNNNTAAQASTVYDAIPPTVTIQGAPAIVADTAAYPITVKFSENISGFLVGDIAVSNGAVSDYVAVDDKTFTAKITPTGGGDIAINIAAGVAQDIGTNDNLAASQVVTIFDDTPPTVDIQGEPVTVNGVTSYVVTFQFSEAVTGFSAGDVNVGNGSLSHLEGGPQTYTATITPTGTGNITIDVAADVAQDAAGNGDAAATQAVTVFDNTAPTLTIQMHRQR